MSEQNHPGNQRRPLFCTHVTAVVLTRLSDKACCACDARSLPVISTSPEGGGSGRRSDVTRKASAAVGLPRTPHPAVGVQCGSSRALERRCIRGARSHPVQQWACNAGAPERSIQYSLGGRAPPRGPSASCGESNEIKKGTMHAHGKTSTARWLCDPNEGENTSTASFSFTGSSFF